jgi:hypothetical protein
MRAFIQRFTDGPTKPKPLKVAICKSCSWRSPGAVSKGSVTRCPSCGGDIRYEKPAAEYLQ